MNLNDKEIPLLKAALVTASQEARKFGAKARSFKHHGYADFFEDNASLLDELASDQSKMESTTPGVLIDALWAAEYAELNKGNIEKAHEYHDLKIKITEQF